jgi:hypothetical protein
MVRQSKPSVPVFSSDEEEFEFWETHDPEDYVTGEFVSLDSILGPEDAELVVNLRLEPGPGRPSAWTPLAVHCAVKPLPHEADHDPSLLFEHEALHGLDGYGVEYRRATFGGGAWPGSFRELTVHLTVASRAEAERIVEALQARLSDLRTRRAKDSLRGRAKELAERVASWLQARNARAISKDEAQALLHP